MSRSMSAAVLGIALGVLPVFADGEPSRLDRAIDRIVVNERELADRLGEYRPIVETYLQTVQPDPVRGAVPVDDNYFIGRLRLDVAGARSPDDRRSRKKPRDRARSLELFDEFHSQTFKPESFAKMLVVDVGSFDRTNYAFEFVRAEFLGEVRTLVFDVVPRTGDRPQRKRQARFTGRIWVEDRGFHIVRFNGIYSSAMVRDFHFDSWRLEMQPGVWLPAYVYTEEPDTRSKRQRLKHKGQTRIWGYVDDAGKAEDEFTQVLVDAPQTEDATAQRGRVSPIESARAWRSEAEDNVVRRLERAGLLAPAGEVDDVLLTVVTNLEVTNGLAIDPPVRCRVLLTTPLESFTIGHTIVISRGLIDVLPDEASLAMVLAHELGHVLSGHEIDTTYAFGNQVLVDDREAMDFLFERNPVEERQADAHAVELLRKSPYGDDLETAGLFLKSLTQHADALSSLIRPHFGNRMTDDGELVRMTDIVAGAPALDPASIEQIAALPLGGRVQLDPWSARVELIKTQRVALLSAAEKMPFQVTPLMPYLSRYDVDTVEAASPPPGRAAEPGVDGSAPAVERAARDSR